MTAQDEAEYRARVSRVAATFPPLSPSQLAVVRRALFEGGGRRHGHTPEA